MITIIIIIILVKYKDWKFKLLSLMKVICFNHKEGKDLIYYADVAIANYCFVYIYCFNQMLSVLFFFMWVGYFSPKWYSCPARNSLGTQILFFYTALQKKFAAVSTGA